MPVPRIVTDVVIGGLWAASAVQVTGYTWAAVSSTWTALPEPGSGGSNNTGGSGLLDLSTNKKGQLKSDPLSTLIKNLTGINLNPGDKGTFGLNGRITKAFLNFFGGKASAKKQLKLARTIPNHGLGPVGK